MTSEKQEIELAMKLVSDTVQLAPPFVVVMIPSPPAA
jgi:hypothetical protein